MGELAQLVVNALAVGGIYALIAMSFELAYESTGVVNFATGQLAVMGAMIGASALALLRLHGGLPVGYLATAAAMAVVGLAFFAAVFRPLRGAPPVTIVIGTIAIGMVIQNVAQLVWGPLPVAMRSPVGSGTIHLAGVALPLHAVFVIAVTVALVGVVHALLHATPLGVQMRALAQDAETALLMGIRPLRLYGMIWVLVALLAGIAGVLLAPMWFIDVTMGDTLALKAFAAAIIGGFGSIPGAVCGGVLVGLAEILGAAYVSSDYKDAFVFALMIAFLVLRPQGLFGERIGARG